MGKQNTFKTMLASCPPSKCAKLSVHFLGLDSKNNVVEYTLQ